MIVTLYQIGKVHYRFLGTIGFQVKAENERFTAAVSCCCLNSKYDVFMSSFGRIRQKNAVQSVPHMQHDHFFSFNQSY